MTAIWFDTNAIFIEGIDTAFVAGTLVASTNGDTITVARSNAGPQIFTGAYSDVTRADGSGFASAAEAKAYLDGEFNRRRSLDLPSVTAVADVDLAAGMPLAVSRRSGQAILARADAYAEAFVAGLCAADVAAGFVATATRNALTLLDWTAAAGTAALAVGQPYFLAPTGGITTTPDLTSGLCLVRVGNATGPQTLTPVQSDPILL